MSLIDWLESGKAMTKRYEVWYTENDERKVKSFEYFMDAFAYATIKMDYKPTVYQCDDKNLRKEICWRVW